MNYTKSSIVFAAVIMSAQMAWAEEVRVYNWSDYIDEDLLSKFEEEYIGGLDLNHSKRSVNAYYITSHFDV